MQLESLGFSSLTPLSLILEIILIQYKLVSVFCSPKMMHFSWMRHSYIQYVIVIAKSFAEFLLYCSYNSTMDRGESL